MNELQKRQIQHFRSVFKGREDVFAVRWETGKKSGIFVKDSPETVPIQS